jgi:hypothetical protein
MGFSIDARTLEEVITELISSHRDEDRDIGYKIWDEAKKVAPVLLGEKSHIKVDKWKIKNEEELRGYMEERFKHLPVRYNARVNVIDPKKIDMYTDRFNTALVAFPYVDASLEDIFNNINESDVKEILQRAHRNRAEFDVLHPTISHGGLMLEFVMGYHGYRDIFRHRRGSRSLQLLTTRLGFEVMDIFKSFNLEKEYLDDMKKCAEVYESARKISPHVAEKLVPFGANCRSLYSWQLNQIGYVGKLRGNIAKGNRSYVQLVREMIEKVSELMPETARYFKIDKRDYPAHLWKAGYEWYDLRVENGD